MTVDQVSAEQLGLKLNPEQLVLLVVVGQGLDLKPYFKRLVGIAVGDPFVFDTAGNIILAFFANKRAVEAPHDQLLADYLNHISNIRLLAIQLQEQLLSESPHGFKHQGLLKFPRFRIFPFLDKEHVSGNVQEIISFLI